MIDAQAPGRLASLINPGSFQRALPAGFSIRKCLLLLSWMLAAIMVIESRSVVLHVFRHVFSLRILLNLAHGPWAEHGGPTINTVGLYLSRYRRKSIRSWSRLMSMLTVKSKFLPWYPNFLIPYWWHYRYLQTIHKHRASCAPPWWRKLLRWIMTTRWIHVWVNVYVYSLGRDKEYLIKFFKVWSTIIKYVLYLVSCNLGSLLPTMFGFRISSLVSMIP